MLDLGERQFLAQLVALTAVAGEVDRFRLEVRFIKPVELLLNRLDAALLLRRPLAHTSRSIEPESWRY